MKSRPVWAEVDLGAIKNNVQEIRRLVGQRTIMAVVKANAYGHGAFEVSKACLAAGADRLAVAILNEGEYLRRRGIESAIMVLGWTPPEDYPRALENDIILTIYNLKEAEELNKIAARIGKTAKVHLKVDTGMGRIGFTFNDKNVNAVNQILNLQNLFIEGIFTHFAKADERDKSYTYLQLERFIEFIAKVEKQSGYKFPIKHAANSAAIIDIPDAHLDMVRPGIILYGLQPSDQVNLAKINLRAALSLKARASRIERVPEGTSISYGGIFTTSRETILAALPIGYADGYTRLLTGKGEVLYNSKRFPIIGKICMDQCMVDITDSPQIRTDDDFILLGQNGNNCISADEIGEKLGTINYEVVCMISARVPRVYIE
ncbi:MAG: alanine racemase [Bacillota bacterium]